MNIVFTAEGINWDSKMDARFGRAKYFTIYNEEEKLLTNISNSDAKTEAHGAGPKAAQKLAEVNAKIIITGNGPGENAAKILDKLGITCYIGARDMSIKEAYEAYKNNKLAKFQFYF